MATLTVKNLPDALFKKLQAGGSDAPWPKRSPSCSVKAVEASERLSILELQGLGKEHWKSIDAAAHVKGERSSWD